MNPSSEACNADQLQDLVRRVGCNDASALAFVEQLLSSYPKDVRLTFLRASVLGGLERYSEAIEDFRHTLLINPSYDIARFQLGLMLLTQKDVGGALQAWQPFEGYPRNHALAMFALGLRLLLANDLAAAHRTLQAGIALNTDFPALSEDMKIIVDRLSAPSPDRSRATLGDPSVEHLLISEYLLGRYRAH